MTHASVQHPVAKSRALSEMVVDRIWRFFCSVRAAIAEITILAILVLAGTLRGSSVPQAIADIFPVTTPIIDRWYAWDVFRSLPFAAILTLLAVAIAVCTINRAPGIWQAIAHPSVTTTHGFLRNAEISVLFVASMPADALAKQLESAMRGNRYRTLSEERNGEIHLYADRSRFSRLATFPFHLALIMILAGGIVGAAWGFRESEFYIPEGSVRELGHGTGLDVRLDDFSEVYREDGTALAYRSDITVMRDGQPVESGSMSVNNPLTFGNIVFYQSGFGQAVALKIEDSAGQVLFDDALPLDTLQLRPGEMFFMIRPLGGESPITEPVGATVRQGDSIKLGDLSLTFIRERRFSVLQVASNPGIPLFIAASVLLVGGLAVTFYFPHRRVRGIVSTTTDGSSARLAPIARRDWSAKRVFERLAIDLGCQIGTGPELHVNEPASSSTGSGQSVRPSF